MGERQYVVRAARTEDADAICSVYNEGIADRATLETETRPSDERRRWLASRDARYPVIVAEHSGAVVGWASLNVFNPREAYRHVADISVYVARSSRGKGAGSTLLDRLATSGCTAGAGFARWASTASRACWTAAGSMSSSWSVSCSPQIVTSGALPPARRPP